MLNVCLNAKVNSFQQWSGRMLQMKRLSLRNNCLKLETSGELPIILEESIEFKAKLEDVKHVTGWI